MFKIYIYSFSLFFFSALVFSQNNINISGKVKSGNDFLPEVLLELQIQKTTKYAVSNTDGDYHFTSINCSLNDTLQLKVNYLGYKSFIKTIIINEENIAFDVDLEKNIEVLNEVVIESKGNTLQTANKNSYKINSKNFIKNAKATEVLKTVPNLFYNEVSGVTVEGNLKGKVFINGIETMPNEIKAIKASEIDRIEVMSNPSSIYGTDFFGAIVNIVTKKNPEQLFKGSIGMTGGIKNNHWAVNPNFAYKKGMFSFKTDMNYLQYNQIVTDKINRTDSNGYYIQNSTDNSKIIQNYINATIGFKFSKKSDFTITGYDGGYKIKGDVDGTSSLNGNINNFKNINQNNDTDLEINSVYKNKISDAKTFYFKNKYAVISNFYTSEYKSINIDYLDIKSQIKEFTSNLSYIDEGFKIFKKNAIINYDLKYIRRYYDFSNTDFYVNQNIFNATSDVIVNWNDKFSTQTALTLENSTNKNKVFSKEYNLILPTLNFIYHFKNKINARFGYSMKVLRPSPTDLNETLVIYSPTSAKQGNSNLNQQKRNYYSLSFNKEFKKQYVFLKFYRASISNSIVNVYKTQGDLLINTLENAAKFNSTGMDFGYETKLFKKIGLNINSGFNYNIYETDNSSVLIKKNDGIGFNSSLSLSTKLFKDKISTSFSGMYSGPDYTLLSKSVSYPYLDFNINTNLLKDKLALSLYVQNLLGNNATITRDRSYTDIFQQNHESRNNFTNVLLSLTYNFGKSFDNYSDENNIENDDVRK